jgi:hypothetical protein
MFMVMFRCCGYSIMPATLDYESLIKRHLNQRLARPVSGSGGWPTVCPRSAHAIGSKKATGLNDKVTMSDEANEQPKPA